MTLRNALMRSVAVTAFLVSPAIAFAADTGPAEPQMSDGATPVPTDTSIFGPDPDYEDKPYDPEAQRLIYGGKSDVGNARPPLELGRPLYVDGPFHPGGGPEDGYTFLGEKNRVFPHIILYGDSRTAVAFNDNGANEVGQLATRLNLDLDVKITSTERIHAFFRPLDNLNRFSRVEFFGDDGKSGEDELILDGNVENWFFEGDLGAITAGITGESQSWDLPFSFGLMPMVLQNGIWMEDAFLGGAFALPALHSKELDITNFDVTFFAGFEDITTNAFVDNTGARDDTDVSMYGVTTFMELQEGYLEAGYAFVDGHDEHDDLDYHNATIAFTRRYGGWLSNSARVIVNFGQDPDAGRTETADGALFLLENSLITHLPSTFIPYANFFVGIDRPQPLARVDGVLKNTGILFETDGLTGFPKLDDTAGNTYGGAIGLQYLFSLDQQIVVEAAALDTLGFDNDSSRGAQGTEAGLGIRWQKPISNRMILRADAMTSYRENQDNQSGIRLEFRVKL